MANESSFDIVSKVDRQEVDNALNQAAKEVAQRYDFKNIGASIDWSGEKIVMTANSEERVLAILDVFQMKLIKRGISLQALDYQKIEPAEKATVRQPVKLKQGIESEKAKAVVKTIKDAKLKVQASIQGDQLRVTSKSKDDLQATMNLIRSQDFGLPLQFTNYR